jgi:hypothetical protein
VRTSPYIASRPIPARLAAACGVRSSGGASELVIRILTRKHAAPRSIEQLFNGGFDPWCGAANATADFRHVAVGDARPVGELSKCRWRLQMLA